MSRKTSWIIWLVIIILGMVIVASLDRLPNNQSNPVISDSTNQSTPMLTSLPSKKQKPEKLAYSAQQEENENSIASCDKALEQDWLSQDENIDTVTKSLIEDTQKFLTRLDASESFNSQLTRTLLSAHTEDSDTLNRLAELYRNFPESKLLSYDLVNFCTISSGSCDENIYQQAISLDRENGALWLSVAIRNIVNQDEQQAIYALNQLASKPVYNEYWGKHVELFASTLESAGASRGLAVDMTAISFAGAIPVPAVGALFSFCKDKSATQADIAEACLNAGAKMAENDKTFLTQAFGLALQDNVYEKLEDEQNREYIKQRKLVYDRQLNLYNKATELAWSKKQLAQDWFTVLKNNGESVANYYIIDEAIRVSSAPDFDPCKIE